MAQPGTQEEEDRCRAMCILEWRGVGPPGAWGGGSLGSIGDSILAFAAGNFSS